MAEQRRPSHGFGATFANTRGPFDLIEDDPRVKRMRAVSAKVAEKQRAALALRVFGKKC